MERRWVRMARREAEGRRMHTAAVWLQSAFRGHRGRKVYRALRTKAKLPEHGLMAARRLLREAETSGRGRHRLDQQLAREGLVEAEWFERQLARRLSRPSYLCTLEETSARAGQQQREELARFEIPEQRARGCLPIEYAAAISRTARTHGRHYLLGCEVAIREREVAAQRAEIKEMRMTHVAGRVVIRELLRRRKIAAEFEDLFAELQRWERFAVGLVAAQGRERDAVRRDERRLRQVISDEQERVREPFKAEHDESHAAVVAAEKRRWGLHHYARDIVRGNEGRGRVAIAKQEDREWGPIEAQAEEELPEALQRIRERLRKDRAARTAHAVAEHFARKAIPPEEEEARGQLRQAFLMDLLRLSSEWAYAEALRRYALRAAKEREQEWRAKILREHKRSWSALCCSAKLALRLRRRQDADLRAKWAHEQSFILFEEEVPRRQTGEAEDFRFNKIMENCAEERPFALARETARIAVESKQQGELMAVESAGRAGLELMEQDWFLPVVEAQELDWRPFNEHRESSGRTFVLQAMRIDAMEIGGRPDIELEEYQAFKELERLAAEEYVVAMKSTELRNASLIRLSKAFCDTEKEERYNLRTAESFAFSRFTGEMFINFREAWARALKSVRGAFENRHLDSRDREVLFEEEQARGELWEQRASEVAHWIGVFPGGKMGWRAQGIIKCKELSTTALVVGEAAARWQVMEQNTALRVQFAELSIESQHRARVRESKRIRAAAIAHGDFVRNEINRHKVQARMAILRAESMQREEEMEDESSGWGQIIWLANDRQRQISEEQMVVIDAEMKLRTSMEDDEDERWDRIASSCRLSVEVASTAALRRKEIFYRGMVRGEATARATVAAQEAHQWHRRFARFRKRAALTFWAEALDAWEPRAKVIREEQEIARSGIVLQYTIRVGLLAAAAPPSMPHRLRQAGRMPSISMEGVARSPRSAARRRTTRKRALGPPSMPLKVVRVQELPPFAEDTDSLSPRAYAAVAFGRFGSQAQRPARKAPQTVPEKVQRSTSKQAVRNAIERALAELAEQLSAEELRADNATLGNYLAELGRGRQTTPLSARGAAGPTQDELALLMRIASEMGTPPAALREAIALLGDARGLPQDARVGGVDHTANRLSLLLTVATEQGQETPALSEVMAHLAALRSATLQGRRATANELSILLAAGVEMEEDGADPMSCLFDAAGAIGVFIPGMRGYDDEPATPVLLADVFGAGDGCTVQAAYAECTEGFGLGDLHIKWDNLLTEEEQRRGDLWAEEQHPRRVYFSLDELGRRNDISVQADAARFALLGQLGHITTVVDSITLQQGETRWRRSRAAAETEDRELLRRAEVRSHRAAAAAAAAAYAAAFPEQQGERGRAAHRIQRAWRRHLARLVAAFARDDALDGDVAARLSEEAALSSAAEAQLEEEAERGVCCIEEAVERDRLAERRAVTTEQLKQLLFKRPPSATLQGLARALDDQERIGREKIDTLREYGISEVGDQEVGERKQIAAAEALEATRWQRPGSIVRGRRLSKLSEMEWFEMGRRVVREEMRSRLHLEDAEFSARSEVGCMWRTDALVAACYRRAEEGAGSIAVLCRRISWMGHAEPLHAAAPGGPPPVRRHRGVLPRIMEEVSPDSAEFASRRERMLDEEMRMRGGLGRLAMLAAYREREHKGGAPRPPQLRPLKDTRGYRPDIPAVAARPAGA
eukprot:TRINITY_DN64946_c0_g1_i1.p1 TRINITY_DN64946_c0_g1~~TRINITY_DN64946_c0_g1_i1.p1  ORF type:complete len:1890 (+),score=760.27 TRINITY_DN64946_c0_g1_i1:578-5671(+)